MSVINRKDIITDEAFKSLDDLAIKLQKIVDIGKKAQTNLTGSGVKKVTKETKKLATAETELAKITKQVNTAKLKQNDEYRKQQKELIETRKQEKDLINEFGRELGTIEKLTKRNRDLRDQRKALNLETKKGQAQLKSINKELDKNNKVLKTSNDQLGKQKINIGNYQSALSTLPGPLGGAVRATQALTSASWKFIATPIGAIIAALALVVSSLGAMFTSSAEGQAKFTKIMNALGVIVGNVTDILSDFGELLWAIATFDYDGIKESWDGVTEGVTGLVDETMKEIRLMNELSDEVERLRQLENESLSNFAANRRRVAELRQQSAVAERTDIKLAMELMKEAQELQKIQAIEIVDIEKRKLAVMIQEAQLSNTTAEVEKEIAEQKAKIIDLETKNFKQLVTLDKQITTLEKKALQEQIKKTKELDKQQLLIKQYNDRFKEGLSDIEKVDPESSLDVWLPSTDALKERMDANIEEYKKGQDKLAEIDKEAKDKRDEIIQEGIKTSKQIFGDFTQLRIQQIGQEINALEFARNRELESAGENERAKSQINKKFDNERRDLERKQANANKANALFNIAISTAQSIAKVSPNPVLIALAAAIGASQAAVVLATPLPQFDEGSERTPKDYVAGEKRPELRKSKGKWSLVDRPTMFKNSPGDKIVSGKDTDSILGTVADLAGGNLLTDQKSVLSLLNNDFKVSKRSDENLAYVLKRNNEELIRTIKNKKEVSIRVKNAKVTEKSGNQIIHRINYYYAR